MIWIIFLTVGLLAGFIGGMLLWSLWTYEREQEIERELQREKARKADITLRVWVQEPHGRQWARFLAGSKVNPHQAVDCLARAHFAARSFSEEGMAGILSRRDFRRLRDWLIKGGFAAWINEDHHNQGVEFTNAGRALLRAAADYVNPTLPPERPTPPNGGHGVRMRTHANERSTAWTAH